MKTFLIIACSLLASHCISAQDSIQARIVLVGDAGGLNGKNQFVVAGIKKTVPLDAKTTIIYLGDNLYTYGLPDEQDPSYNGVRAVLDSQANIAAGTKAQVYFIPGNHDWAHEHPDGWNAVLREQYYINLLAENESRVSFYPQDGCPGPVAKEVSKDVVLIMLDTQWWLHQHEKPGIESDCPYKTQEEVLNQLGELLDKYSEKLVILATHHPFKSYGIHGGYFTLKQHIFPLTDWKKNLWIPLPVIGTIYPIVRGVFGTRQDLKHPAYQNMVNEITKVVKGHPHTIFVAGHEHNQQLIYDSSFYYVVEGAGYNHTRVSDGPNLQYRSDTTGFATLEISKNKNVRINFYDVHEQLTLLKKSDPLFNFTRIPKPEVEDTAEHVPIPPGADSITVAINKKFTQVSGLKKFLNGKNYRKTWATPVKFPIFKLAYSGLKIESLGGGKQTKSLTLTDKNGKRWALRTIDKDLTKVVPDNFRNTAAQKYLTDFISTAHPYGPLLVPTLANANNTVVAKPTYYFVPDDYALGQYRQLFANKVVMLEAKEPVPKGDDTKSTGKVINKLTDDNDHRVDQEAVLKARLLDFLIADWDRHFDQWKFWETDTGKGKLYIPVPRDRDWAFSYSDGLLMKFLALNTLPYLQGFRKNIPSTKWLAWEARDFDRFFLNQFDAEQFSSIVKEFQNNITDSVIEAAVHKLPAEVFALTGKEIIEKLKNRRNILHREAMKYYRYLSIYVNVVGSNKKEFFRVSSEGDKLDVKVFKRNSESDSISLMFHRVFDPHDTKEVRLFGLRNDDYFLVDTNTSSRIKLRIIGGKGQDTFNINGSVRNKIYDVYKSENTVLNHKRSRVYIGDDVSLNEYSPTGFQYDKFSYPLLNVAFNPDDGLMVGLGFSVTTYNFRKEPYSTRQKFSSLWAPGRSSFQLKYSGDFTKMFGNTGLYLAAELLDPTLNNFYGLGNNTQQLPGKGVEYYRARYNYAKGEALLTRRPAAVLTLGAGAQIFHYWIEKENNVDKILARPSLIGLDSLSIYKPKTYAGAKLIAHVNTLNNELFPTRGIKWDNEVLALGGIGDNSNSLTQLTSDMTVYTSWREPAKVVTVLRLGGGHIFNKDYEFFQAMNLGQNNFLRGFRKNRFSGKSMAYGSFEVRHKLFNSHSYILPGAVGVIGFAETGRVWVPNMPSSKWHLSYGGGLYYAAYNTILISAGIAFSDEGSLFNFSIGTKFNLTF